MSDPWQLSRFVDAQAQVYPAVCAELEAGRKASHWMWFVFPQLRCLGRSETARRFGLAGPDEARAYLLHPLLGARLQHCAGLVMRHTGKSALAVFGTPDNLKLCSSMTLFASVAPGVPVFASVLDAFFAGRPDALTVAALSSGIGDVNVGD